MQGKHYNTKLRKTKAYIPTSIKTVAFSSRIITTEIMTEQIFLDLNVIASWCLLPKSVLAASCNY